MNVNSEKESADASHQTVQEALSQFREGRNCAQAILSAFGPGLGLDGETALKVAGAFGSGMGMGETCGAVSGALMVIGLKYTQTLGSSFSKDRNEAAAHEFLIRFRELHGFTGCRDLLGCDVSTSAGLKKAKRKGHFNERCPKFVQAAAVILAELLGRDSDRLSGSRSNE